jgi:hypothetical protein
MPAVLRQVAGMYAVRALDFLAEGGTLCLILPITQLLGAGAKRYLPYLFDRIAPRRLINLVIPNLSGPELDVVPGSRSA